jgi:circadian clock protein KaiB
MSGGPFRFRLYVLGGHVGSARAEPDLRAALEAAVPGRYELEIVDLRARPDLAAADQVLAAPTVIRLAPLPERRAVGSLSDARSVAQALGLAGGPGA